MLRQTLYSELAKWSIEFTNLKAGDEVLICVSPDTDTTRYSALVTHLKVIDAIPHVLVVNTPKEAVGLWSLGRKVKLPRTLAMALRVAARARNLGLFLRRISHPISIINIPIKI